MNSSTAIANASLLLIGAKELTDLDTDTTTTGRIAQRWYAHTRDSILRGYTWNFALRRQALSKDATGPDFEFTNSFTLPTDPYCLRALVMFDSDSEWKVEGRKLLTDDGTANLKYIARIADTVEFDDLYTDALIYRFAANMAFPVMRDKVLQDRLTIQYLERVREARSADAIEGTFNKIRSEVFIDSRRTGSTIPPATPPSSAGSAR